MSDIELNIQTPNEIITAIRENTPEQAINLINKSILYMLKNNYIISSNNSFFVCQKKKTL